MTIKSVKLVSGEEIICEYDYTEGARQAILKNPVQLVMVPSRTGTQPNFGFVPYPVVQQVKELPIKKHHIMFDIDVPDEIKNEYNSIFGNGIVTPPKTLII